MEAKDMALIEILLSEGFVMDTVQAVDAKTSTFRHPDFENVAFSYVDLIGNDFTYWLRINYTGGMRCKLKQYRNTNDAISGVREYLKWTKSRQS